MDTLKDYKFAEMEKSVMTAVAERQVKKLREAFMGLDKLDTALVDQLVPQLAVPIRKIYCGELYSLAGKSFISKRVNSSQEIAATISQSNHLQSNFFFGNEFSNLSSFRNKDLERIQAVFAGIDTDEDIACQLIEIRADAFRDEYSKALRSQIPNVFGPKRDIGKPIPAPGDKTPLSDENSEQAAGAALANS